MLYTITITYRRKGDYTPWLRITVDNMSTIESLEEIFKINSISKRDWKIIKINNSRVNTSAVLTPELLVLLRDLELPPEVLKWFVLELSFGDVNFIGVYTSMKEIAALRLFGTYQYVYSVVCENKYYAFNCSAFLPSDKYKMDNLYQCNRHV